MHTYDCVPTAGLDCLFTFPIIQLRSDMSFSVFNSYEQFGFKEKNRKISLNIFISLTNTYEMPTMSRALYYVLEHGGREGR